LCNHFSCISSWTTNNWNFTYFKSNSVLINNFLKKVKKKKKKKKKKTKKKKKKKKKKKMNCFKYWIAPMEQPADIKDCSKSFSS